MKIFILFFLFSASIFADTCEQANIKVIFDKKIILTKETLCLKKTADNMLFYISKSCVDDKCSILKKNKSEIKIKDYYNRVGSPGFKFCRELGGVPQIFEFKNLMKSDWQSVSRCLFSNEDFVEISLLTKEWKSFVKK